MCVCVSVFDCAALLCSAETLKEALKLTCSKLNVLLA